LRASCGVLGWSLGVLGHSREVLRASWAVVGRSWHAWGALEDVLGVSWAVLGLSGGAQNGPKSYPRPIKHRDEF